jgi:ATP-binding cassette, subfamily B, bacterial
MRLRDRVPYLIRTLRLVWKAARGWTTAWMILLVIQGLLPIAVLYFTRLLVDALAAAIGGGVSFANFQPVLVNGLFVGGVLLLIEVMGVCTEWVRTAQSELVQDHISAIVQDKSVSLDLAFFEMPEFYDHLYRARTDATSRPLALLESTGNVMQNGITLVAMAAVLIPYGLWLPVALLISTLPAFYVVIRSNRLHHAWWTATTPLRRRAQYCEVILTDGFFAPEVRLFGLAGHFQTAFRSLRQQLRTERLQLLKTQFFSRLGAEVMALIVSGATLVWILRQALLGAVTLGDIALFYQAFQRGHGLVRSLLGNVGQIYTNSLFLGNLFEFLELKSTVVEPAHPIAMPPVLKHGISFRNVKFRYPGSDRTVLQNFNLTLPAGKIIAIVGANGSGKSTLLKLMCRFHDPEEGSVELDGIDLRAVSLAELRNRIRLTFQMPVHYQTTARENITMGSLKDNPTLENVQNAARSAGADEVIARLPQNYDTILGKWFAEGTELSAGEWQRIATARAFLRNGDIIILDEPTSMMDSWSEVDWFDRLRVLASGRTTVIITHRLTIAMRAHLICVMMKGQLVESGTHQELLARDGHYARSWNSQTQAETAEASVI